jgi:hypothetical protein
MSLAADDAELPGDPEFRAALIGYLEWGTRLAMHNSQPGADKMSADQRLSVGERHRLQSASSGRPWRGRPASQRS